LIDCPVIPLALSEHKNNARSATSLIVGNLPNAVCPIEKFWRNLSELPWAGDDLLFKADIRPGVSINTGHTAFTLIPWGPSSLHKL
jgi:hypothetical protein